MSMDVMPDDCLLNIFDFIEDPLVLFRCLRVCKRWYCLVSYRLAKVENLLDEFSYQLRHDEKTLCYYPVRRPLEEPILSGILKKSPNIKVVCIGFEYGKYPAYDINWPQKSIDRLSQLKSLRGIILSDWLRAKSLKNVPQNIDLLSSNDTAINEGYYPRIKELIIDGDIFSDSIQRFPNVERLSLMIDSDPDEWFEAALQNRHLFKKLKIFQIDTSYELSLTEQNYACQFIDLCPQLESAHIKIAIDQNVPCNYFRHKNLKNLVITYVDFELVDEYYANLLGLLHRYPNIEHLAIKYEIKFTRSEASSSDDSDIGEFASEQKVSSDRVLSSQGNNNDVIFQGSAIPFLIVAMLKKLVLLDMRNIAGVDAISAETIREYCQRANRSVKFYYGFDEDDKIKRDWPELFTDVSHDPGEVNFMKQLFLRDYERWPFFLTPI